MLTNITGHVLTWCHGVLVRCWCGAGVVLTRWCARKRTFPGPDAARGCDQLIQGNLVPLVAATVEANPTSPDVALYACWILSHLVYCTPDLDLRNRVDSEGGTGEGAWV